jgi:hypothetical protein
LEPFHLWQTKKELYIASQICRRESLSQQSLGKSEQNRKKRNLQRSERRLPPASQEQRIRLPGELCCPLPLWKWTRITRKKEANEVKARQAALLVSPPSKENMKKLVTTTVPFYPDVLFIGGRVESTPVSDDEPTASGEEPLQQESR